MTLDSHVFFHFSGSLICLKHSNEHICEICFITVHFTKIKSIEKYEINKWEQKESARVRVLKYNLQRNEFYFAIQTLKYTVVDTKCVQSNKQKSLCSMHKEKQHMCVWICTKQIDIRRASKQP